MDSLVDICVNKNIDFHSYVIKIYSFDLMSICILQKHIGLSNIFVLFKFQNIF